MKKIIATLLCAVVLLSASLVSVSAITKSDTPIVGGNTIFTVKEFMYKGEPTATSAWSNAFCNEDWTGCRWTATVEDGIECIAVTAVQGNGEHYMDFNWYQWDNDKYYPALDCSEYKFFKVKYKLNEAAAVIISEIYEGRSEFVSKTQDELGKGGKWGILGYTMTVVADEWVEVIVPIHNTKFNGFPWEEETIRQFMYYPFGSIAQPIPYGVCYIEYMGFFKTEEEAIAFTNAAPGVPSDPGTDAPETADRTLVSVLAAFVSFGVATSVVIARKRAK